MASGFRYPKAPRDMQWCIDYTGNFRVYIGLLIPLLPTVHQLLAV